MLGEQRNYLLYVGHVCFVRSFLLLHLLPISETFLARERSNVNGVTTIEVDDTMLSAANVRESFSTFLAPVV
jgi:hypothetical protein